MFLEVVKGCEAVESRACERGAECQIYWACQIYSCQKGWYQNMIFVGTKKEGKSLDLAKYIWQVEISGFLGFERRGQVG